MDEQTRNETIQNVLMTPPKVDEPRRIKIISFGKNKKWLKRVVVGIAVVIVVALFFIFGGVENSDYDKDKWQTVFLNNGQVYFGHIVESGAGEVILRDVYYPQKPVPLQQGTDTVQQGDFTIVKFGGEIYGTEDEMRINGDTVLFIANLKDDSKIIQAIKKHKDKNK